MERFLQSPIRRYDSRHKPEPATPGLSLNFQEMFLRSPSPKALRNSIRNPLKHYIKSIDNPSSPPPSTTTNTASSTPSELPELLDDFSDISSTADDQENIPPAHYCQSKNSLFASRADPVTKKRIVFRELALSEYYDADLEGVSFTKETKGEKKEYLVVERVVTDKGVIDKEDRMKRGGVKEIRGKKESPFIRKLREVVSDDTSDDEWPDVTKTPIRIPSAGTNKSTPEAVESPFWHSVDENDKLRR
ncbi:10750_t:CDS:2 [Paraglomus occultum]|uniref:10750_t:CDS:1 n=1 Tax=Paraglomus occultum TaxID=144539 RepID=A0A9N8VQ56_9GLOM|nr:10750_t:CDS:2 [Paraglomus occultum]